MTTESRTAVIGAGSWGCALAILLAGNGYPVRIWGRDAKQMAAMADERVCSRYLPGCIFPDTLECTSDWEYALADAAWALIAVPSDAFGGVVGRLARTPGGAGLGVAWATKGFDPAGELLHVVLERELPGTAGVVISGPTFAAEVARGRPSALSCASMSLPAAEAFAQLLRNQSMRVYPSTDVVGVQVGGAVKNVLAIAAGIADGLAFGANTRAALITRGLAELMRLGSALGGEPQTLMGLSGLGDLVLTCTDDQSRNRRFGLALAEGLSPAQASAQIGQVVEGVKAVKVVMALAQERGVEMPIAEQVGLVLAGVATPREAVTALLSRPPALEV